MWPFLRARLLLMSHTRGGLRELPSDVRRSRTCCGGDELAGVTMDPILRTIEDFFGEELSVGSAKKLIDLPIDQVDELIYRLDIANQSFRSPGGNPVVADRLVRWGQISDVDQLKRLLLIVDSLVVPDPVSEVTAHVALDQGFGATDGVRQELSRAFLILSQLRPFLAAGDIALQPFAWLPWSWLPDPQELSPLVRSALPDELPEDFEYVDDDLHPEIMADLPARVFGTPTLEEDWGSHVLTVIDVMNAATSTAICNELGATPAAFDPVLDLFLERTMTHTLDLVRADLDEVILRSFDWRVPDLYQITLDEIASLRQNDEYYSEFRAAYGVVLDEMNGERTLGLATPGLDFRHRADEHMSPIVDRLNRSVARSTTLSRRVRAGTSASIAVGGTYMAYRTTGSFLGSAVIAALVAEADARVSPIVQKLSRRRSTQLDDPWLSFYAKIL